jgi:Ca2+-binding RTX toxin-like protein
MPAILRSFRALAAFAVLAAATSAFFVVPAVSAPGDNDPADVKGLRAGVGELTGWLGDLQGEGQLARQLPGVTTTVGDALNLDSGMSGLRTAIEAVQADDVAQLATKLAALNPGGTSIQTSAVDTTGPIVGFDLHIAATRSIAKAPFELLAPAAGGKPALGLASATGEGVPLTATFDATFTVHYDQDRDAFFVDAGPATPQLAAAAKVANFTIPATGFRSAIGFGDLKVDPSSSFDLAAALAGKVTDANGDGRLAFEEPGNPQGGNEKIDAELRLPANQNVTITRSGSATAAIGLDSPYTAANDDVTLSLAGSPLGATNPEATVGGADATELGNFENVSGVEVLSGLASYATAIRAIQASPNADATLPLMSGRISDVVQAQADVARFVDAHTQQIPPGGSAQDATDFHTVGQLLTAMQAAPAAKGLAGLQDTNGAADGSVSPVYNADKDRLTFDLELKVDKAEAPIVQPPAGPNGQQTATIGRPQIGGLLADLTGIGSLGDTTTNPQSQAKSTTSYTVHLPFVIDLRDPVAAGDDPLTDGLAEFQDPMPNERYGIDTSGADEVKTTADVKTPVTDSGTIGFVRFSTGAASNLAVTRKDPAKPTLAIDVDATRASLPAVVSVSDLLREMNKSGGTNPIAPVKPNWKLDGKILEDVRGPGSGGDADDYRLTDQVGTVDLHWADATQTIAGSDVELDDTAKILKALDVVPGQPQALLGRTLDQANGLLDAIDGLFDDKPLLDQDVPFLGTSARDLFAAGRTLNDQLNAVRSTPPATLQDLELAIQNAVGEKLGVTGAARQNLVRFAVKNLGDATSAPELITRIGLGQQTSEDRPVSLPINAVNASLAGAEAGGKVHVDAATDFKLAFPLTLDSNAPSGLDILDSSGFSLSAAASDDDGDLSLKTSLGPIELRLGGGGRLGAGVRFTGYPNGTQVPEASEQRVAIAQFLTSVAPKVAAAQDGGYDCTPNDKVTVHGDLACVAMPVFINNNPVYADEEGKDGKSNFLKVAIADDLSPTVTLPTGIDASTLLSQALNVDSLADGVKKLEQILKLAVDGASFGAKLPLIGDQLAAGATVLARVHDLTVKLESLTLNTAVNAGQINQQLRQAIFNALGPVLKDSNYAAAGAYPGDLPGNAVNDTDVRVLMRCGAGACDPGASFATITDLSVDFEIGKGDPGACEASGGDACPDGTDLPLDFSLPGINLSGPGGKPITSKAGWSLALGFGVNKAGFYVKDDPLPANGTDNSGNGADATPELALGFRAGIKPNAAGDELTGRLGFLDIGMEDGDSQSSLNAGFTTDLKSPGGPGPICDPAPANQHCSARIDIAQIPGLDVRSALLPKVSGGLDVTLGLKTGVDTGTNTADLAAKLPKLTTDFVFKWGFTSDAISSLDKPEIAFKNVGIDPGTVFSSTLNPIFRGIQRFTKPIKPIREFIFAPIPIISNLSRLFGGDDVSFVDLAGIFGDVDLTLLKDVDAFLSFIDHLPTAAGQPILLGNFMVPGGQAVGPPATPDQAQAMAKPVDNNGDPTALPGSIQNAAFGAIDNGTTQELKNLQDSNGDSSKDIEIPILDKPGCVFGMLMGGDCDLFRYHPDPFKIRFDYEQPFGPFFGVLYVTVGGYASALGRLDVGYDTRGLRELIQGIQAGTQTVADSAGDLLDGVYLGDLDASGKDVNELEVSAGITAGAKLSVVIAEAGARGGIDATVGLNLHDGPEVDGKLRINEIRKKIAVPFCLFDINGRLSAFLEAYLKAGIGPLSVTKTFELARIVLLDFTEGFCPNNEPVLARPESPGSSTLLLNIGTRDWDRGTGWENSDLDNKGNESFVVRQTAPHSVDVTALGFTKDYHGVDTIKIVDAGDGDDSILFQGLKEGGQTGESLQKTPGVSAPFTLPVTAESLGIGKDSITTGTSKDSVKGGGDGDSINLGDGEDYADGEGGTDSILGGSGKDDLWGGDDPDHVDGGLGGDDIDGGKGDDDIDGGRDLNGPGSMPANDEAVDGGDTIFGWEGNDKIDGGSGKDTIFGDGDGSPGQDVINGSLDSDTVFAGNGDDKVFGNTIDEGRDGVAVDESKDFLHGGGGSDQLHGQRGDDEISGDGDGDFAFGELGDDDIHGNTGSDTLRGAAGIDTVHGDEDDDDIFGDADDDQLFGDDGADTVFGAGGNDDIDGGPGNDRGADGGGLFGDDGDDDMKGGAGQDDLFGGSGFDIELGDEGTIDDANPAARVASPQASIGAGDRLFGDNQGDELYGEGGGDELRGGNDGDLGFGNDGSDLIIGQTGDDRLIGGSASGSAGDVGDTIFGSTENDVLLGDNGTIAPDKTFVLGPRGIAGTAGNDTLNGGPGEDILHGQDGNDTEYGAEDVDRMFGDLGDDTMQGNDGADFMLGDLGSVSLDGGTEPGGAPKATPVLEDANTGGIDTMDGGSADDHMYGGASNDIMSGGFADDHMEGNGGQDSMYGASKTANDGASQPTDALDALFDGQDDMIGGSSKVNPLTIDLDEGETIMRGDGAQDVMTGDNAELTRQANGSAWAIDTITGGVGRDVVLYDTEKRGADLDPVGGADLVLGNDANDRLYGESDTDTVKGNNDQDYAEGNQGQDWVEGNNDQDDLIGGSAVAGQPDDGDYIHGGAAADVLTGDNAVIRRAKVPADGVYNYETDRLEIPVKRFIKLLDLTPPAQPDLAGGDQMSGGAGVDVLFGQDEGDYQSGGSEDDYMEGNGDTDRQWGDRLLAEVGVPGVIAALAGSASPEPELSGAQGVDGQDDQIGGSSIKNFRDTGDFQYGDGAADFQLGDNGELLRRYNAARTAYLTYEDANATTLQRQANRFDVGGHVDASGIDEQHGGPGDDYQFGQDDNDKQYGEADNDDMYGELGADEMFGGDGEDAMIGDRGVITDDRILANDADDEKQFTFTTNGPMFVTYTAFRPDELHRFVDLKIDGDGDMDGDGNPIEKPGETVGGPDYMRGGNDHDAMHGAFGDDVMNGDSFGDILYGDDGADAMWGGRGNPDPANPDLRGKNDEWVDYLFGGHGGDPKVGQGVVTGGADVLDYRPRPGQDPAIWFEATNTDAGHPGIPDNQHNHGVDWIYGGWDRDILQSNIGKNGPDGGDRLFDWAGAYNLYTHCYASYGGDNDVRAQSPIAFTLMEKWAYGTGAGTSLADVQSSKSSAFRELALVYHTDVAENTGKAYPTTPGHFEQPACIE